jgi:hypothetical protein
MQYIAKTLLYLKELIEVINLETGDKEQRERGYIQIGQSFELTADDPRPEIWLELDYVELAPQKAKPPAPSKPAPIKNPE